MKSLPYIDLHFVLRVDGALPDLPFLGPTVRGLLGYGLRQSCCGHSTDAHGRCSFADACAYAFLFEGPLQRRLLVEGIEVDALPQPFIPLVPPPGVHGRSGPHVGFGIRLIGTAVDLAGKVATAIHAREGFGFGARSSGYQLLSVAVGGREAWNRASDRHADLLEEAVLCAARADSPAEGASQILAIPAGISTIRWNFLTPVSLAEPRNGAPGADLACRIVEAACRRAWLLSRAYGAPTLQARSMPRQTSRQEFTAKAIALSPFELSRRSTRHGRTVRLQGQVGMVSIEGPWHEFADQVRAAIAFGLGSHTTFGFGRVEAIPCTIDGAHSSVVAVARGAESHTSRSVARDLRQQHAKVPRWIRLRGTPPPAR